LKALLLATLDKKMQVIAGIRETVDVNELSSCVHGNDLRDSRSSPTL